MNDLISRSALTDAIVDLLVFEWGYEGIEASVKRIFSEIPAVDAVAVVRCKDCEWFHDRKDFYCCTKHTVMVKITPDSFCSYGEGRYDK